MAADYTLAAAAYKVNWAEAWPKLGNIKYLPFHFPELNDSISILIIQIEEPGKFLILGPAGSYVKTKWELIEVQKSISVGVKCSEDMLAEVLEFLVPGENFTTKICKLWWTKLSIGTIQHEAVMPLLENFSKNVLKIPPNLYCLLVHSGLHP